MPPRTAASAQEAPEGIDNFQLPKALVTRIAKSVLPPEAKLQKDTVSALVDSATVFINYLAATAHDVASSRSHKTIAGLDVLKALEIVELGDLIPILEAELTVYRGGTAQGKVPDKKGKGKEKEATTVSLRATSAAMGPSISESGAAEGQEEEEEPESEHQEGDEPSRVREIEDPEEAMEEEEGEGEGEAEAEEEEEEEEDVEELIDNLALEDEEARIDARGVEEREHGGMAADT